MRKPTDLRQKVLDASLALIEEEGLDRLSMREVARKAGVSHQAPYHYFEDREAILAALAGEGFSSLGQSLERAAVQAGSNAAKAVEDMGVHMSSLLCATPRIFRQCFGPMLSRLIVTPTPANLRTRRSESSSRVSAKLLATIRPKTDKRSLSLVGQWCTDWRLSS